MHVLLFPHLPVALEFLVFLKQILGLPLQSVDMLLHLLLLREYVIPLECPLGSLLLEVEEHLCLSGLHIGALAFSLSESLFVAFSVSLSLYVSVCSFPCLSVPLCL